jgi:hypothetical protein
LTRALNLKVPFMVSLAGCAGVLLTVALAVLSYDDGFVFVTILGFGMLASGLLLISGAVGAKRLVSLGAEMGGRRNAFFFGIIGVVGVVTALYGAAMLFGV